MRISILLLPLILIFTCLVTESTATLGHQVKNRQISDKLQGLINVLAEGLRSVDECAEQKNIIFFKQEDGKYVMKKAPLVNLFVVANSRRTVSQVVTYKESQKDRIPICASNLVSKVNNSYKMRRMTGFQHYNEARLEKELMNEIEHDILLITIENFTIEKEVPKNEKIEQINENDDEKREEKREEEKAEIKSAEQSEKFDQLAFIIGQSLIAVENCKKTYFGIFQKKETKMMAVENLKALFEKENKIDQTTAKCPFDVLVPQKAIPAFKEYWSDMPEVIKGLNQSKWINAWHGVYGKKIPLNLFEKMLNGLENNELIIKDEKLSKQIEGHLNNQIGTRTVETQDNQLENEKTNENLSNVVNQTNVPESLVDENLDQNDGTEYAEDANDVKVPNPSKKSKIVTGPSSDEPNDKNKIRQQPYFSLNQRNEGGIEETNPVQIHTNSINSMPKIHPETPQNAKPRILATDSTTNVFQFGSGSNSVLFKKQQAINSLDANIEKRENLNDAISPRQNEQFGKSSSMNERDANKKNDNNQRKRAKKSGKLPNSRPSSPRNNRSGGQSQQLTSLTSFNGDSLIRNAGNEAEKKELTKNRSGKQLASVPLFNATQGNGENEKENDSGKRQGNADSSPSASINDKGDKNINVHSINVSDDKSKKSEKNTRREMPSYANSSHINYGNIESGKLPSNSPRAMPPSSLISAANGKSLTHIPSFNTDLLRNGENQNMFPEHHVKEFSLQPDSSHKNDNKNVQAKIGNQDGKIPTLNSPRGTATNSPLNGANVEIEKNVLKKTTNLKQPTPVPSFKADSPRSEGNGKQNVLLKKQEGKLTAQTPSENTRKIENINLGHKEIKVMPLNSETQLVSPRNKTGKKELSKSESKKELTSRPSFNKIDSFENHKIVGQHDNGKPVHLEGHIGSKISENGNPLLDVNHGNIEAQLASASPESNGRTSPKFQHKRPPALNLAEFASTSPEMKTKSQNSAQLNSKNEHSSLNSPSKGKNDVEHKITSPKKISEQTNLNHEFGTKKANSSSNHRILDKVEPARTPKSPGDSKGQMAQSASAISLNEHENGISSPKGNLQGETSLDGAHLKRSHSLERIHSKGIPSKGTNNGEIRSPSNDEIFDNSDALDKIDQQQTHLNADQVAERAKSIVNEKIMGKNVIPAIHTKAESPLEIEANKSKIDENGMEKDKIPSLKKLEKVIPSDSDGTVSYGNATKAVEERISSLNYNEAENFSEGIAQKEKKNAVDIEENKKLASMIAKTPLDEKTSKKNGIEPTININENGVASSMMGEFSNLEVEGKIDNVTEGNAIKLDESKIHSSLNGNAEIHSEGIQSSEGIHQKERERVENANILSAKTTLEENVLLAKKEGNAAKDDGQLEPGITIFNVVSRKNDQKRLKNVIAFSISPSKKGENNTVLDNKNNAWRDCVIKVDDKSTHSNRIKVKWSDCGITKAFWNSADVPILRLHLSLQWEEQQQQQKKSKKKNSKPPQLIEKLQTVVVDFSKEMTNFEGVKKEQLQDELRKLVAGNNAVEIAISDTKPQVKFIENEEKKSNETT